MNNHQQLITSFYTAFQNKDFKTMQDCYSDQAVFNDPVFTQLNAEQTRTMWEMFCTKGKDLRISFSDVEAGPESGTALWIASYTFSKTNKQVVNRIKAHFIFKDGTIISHTDHFNFYRWASQALGLPGKLLGWTPFLKNKVRKSALKNLQAFIKYKQQPQPVA